MNIYLNFKFVLESLKPDSRGDVSIFELISNICTGLNKALGGINNLEPVIDENSNTLKIIDTTPIPGYSGNPSQTPYILQIYGYDKTGTQYNSNFVRNFDLKTAITPEYATMITIGATAGGYVKGTEATAFSKWNDGLRDRYKEDFTPGDSSTALQRTVTPDEAEVNYVTKIASGGGYISRYGLNGLSGGSLKLVDDLIASNISIGTEYYKYLLSQNNGENSGGTVGFIPFKMSIKIDGISGIRIYNKLQVNTEFLPKAYGKYMDLIVTGISHRLSNNDWETSIETTAMPKTGKQSIITIPTSAITTSIANVGPTPSGGGRGSGGTSHGRRKVNTYSTLMRNPKTNSKPIIVPDVATKQNYLRLYSTQLGAGFNNFVIRAGNSNPASKVVKFVNWNNSQATRTISIKPGRDKFGGTVGGQLGNGGDISSALYNALQKLQKELLKPKYSSVIPVLITAGNDSFHQGKTINSSSSYNRSWETTHTRGLAIDLRSSTVDKDNLVIDALEVAGFGGILWHNPPHIHANVDSN